MTEMYYQQQQQQQQQFPLNQPENIRRESQGQKSASHGQASHTLHGGRHHPYDFDSCISTEEAFFGQINEEIKNGYRFNTGNGSNPQEDNTPKAHPATGFHRRTVESINRGLLDHQINQTGNSGGIKAPPGFTAASRQRTQRLSPKGQSMGREMMNPADGGQMTQGNPSPKEVRARNQSVKCLHMAQDDSHGSQKLSSDIVSPKHPSGISGISKKPSKLIKRKSANLNSQGNTTEVIPMMHRRSSQAIEMLMDDYSSDLGDKKSTPVYKSSGSRQSVASPSDSKKLKRLGSSKNRGGSSGMNNGNLSRQRFYGSREVQEKPPGQTESQRVIQCVQNGQTSMKLDMKFGWRPDFNDKDRLHRKEAIAIKLTYPNIMSLCKTSVRNSQLFNELYRQNKNQRVLRSQVKKNYIPDFSSKLVYQGYRPSVSIELHLRYGQKASFNEDSQFYDVLIPKSIKNKAIENGFHKHTPRSPVDESTLKTYECAKDGFDERRNAPNNDKYKCDLSFDSMFESGNLDLALQVQPREFNLYLKPDTNTKGYQSWFFFKVTRKPDAKGKYPRRTYQFNIMNMYKKKCLYRQEARPLACSSEIMYRGFIMQELENVSWKATQFSNIGYGLVTSQTTAIPIQSNSNNQNNDSEIEAIKDDTFVPNDTSAGQNNSRKQKFYCLAFDYEFLSGQEFAYLASSIPYPYTFLQKTIKTCARLDQAMTTLTRSLGGLSIPMLTITNEVINISKKRTVIICGRIHPGETNSSWVLHGMIDYLISKDAGHLRDSLVFKIVPMINPDGVVAGNYRTSFIGKDLNRLYLNTDESNNMDDILKPEITAMKELIKGCKADESKGVLAFIDVHHHSQKRGSFMFGPSYQMQHSKYQEVRVLPKLISMMLPEMFRFQSCRFKNQSYKENCARLYCDKEQGITYSFCLECSQQGYFTQSPAGHKGRYVKYFDQNSLMYLGRKICEASYMLNEMSDVQDQKRDAIQRRRKQRLFGKKGKKTTGFQGAGRGGANNAASSVGGRTGGYSGKGGKGGQGAANDGSSMNGATDFDMESNDLNNSSNMSITSQDFLQNGFNPKIGIKGFIAQMMKKMPKSGGQDGLHSDSSRGALRAKNTRPLTHFGSEDAVSEKSEKEEESLSEDEDGSDGNSSAQDLSEDDHNQVLDEVLDQLMPNRVKKIDPVTAHITITKQAKIEPPLSRPIRKNLKSANKVILIDKKLVQKEQLVIPTAAPDLNINNALNFQVGNNNTVTGALNKNFDLAKGHTPLLDESQQIQIGPNNFTSSNTAATNIPHQKFQKEEFRKTTGPSTNDKSGENSFLQVRQQSKKIQGCFQPGPSQGYISQRQQQQQNKKRIFSGRYTQKQGSKDMFANTGYVPPGAAAQRQAFAQTNLKVHYNNIYSMVQSSAAHQSYYAQQQQQQQQMNEMMIDQQSQEVGCSNMIVNRKSLRTAGHLQHSYSHHGVGSADISTKDHQQMGVLGSPDQLNWAAGAPYSNEPNSALPHGTTGAQSLNANSPISLVRQSFTRTRPRASPQQDFSGSASAVCSRNDQSSSQGVNATATGAVVGQTSSPMVIIPQVQYHNHHSDAMQIQQQTGQVQQSSSQSSGGGGFYQSPPPGVALESQWKLVQQDKTVAENSQLKNSLLSTPGGNKPLKHVIPASIKNKQQSMKVGSHLLTSKDVMNKTAGGASTGGSVLFSAAGSADTSNFIDASHMFTSQPMTKPANIPLSQGGFFHRNQVIGSTAETAGNSVLLDEQLNFQQQPKHKSHHQSPDVIIRTTKQYQNTGAMNQKRKSAIATVKNLSSQAQSTGATGGPVNRISHKRQSQQLMKALGVPPTHQFSEDIVSSHYHNAGHIKDAVTFDSFAIAQKTNTLGVAGTGTQLLPQQYSSANHNNLHKRNITQAAGGSAGRYLLSNAAIGGNSNNLNEDLHDRVMNYQAIKQISRQSDAVVVNSNQSFQQKQQPINSYLQQQQQHLQQYNSPQKQSHLGNNQQRIRLHSGHPKYAKTVAKKTEALIEPTISSANILQSQNNNQSEQQPQPLVMLENQHFQKASQQPHQLQPKSRISLQQQQSSHVASAAGAPRKLITSQMQRNNILPSDSNRGSQQVGLLASQNHGAVKQSHYQQQNLLQQTTKSSSSTAGTRPNTGRKGGQGKGLNMNNIISSSQKLHHAEAASASANNSVNNSHMFIRIGHERNNQNKPKF